MKPELQITLAKNATYTMLLLVLACVLSPIFLAEERVPTILICTFPLAGLTVWLNHLHQQAIKRQRTVLLLQSANRKEVAA